jgi:hypothetical protein
MKWVKPRLTPLKSSTSGEGIIKSDCTNGSAGDMGVCSNGTTTSTCSEGSGALGSCSNGGAVTCYGGGGAPTCTTGDGGT